MPQTLISVATYRRPDLLADLLASLAQSDLPDGTRLCIVDNDPDGSAREVARASRLPVTYEVEPDPGIAAARNRGLDEIRPTDEFIVFVDDDERVSHGWLQALHRVQAEYRADVVRGPVVSLFPAGTPTWVSRGGYLQRARHRTGERVQTAATNNALLRLDFYRASGEPRFDETFSMTGGSDAEFFRGLLDRGARLFWCDEAIVYESVPLARTTFTWIFRRGVRAGNVEGRLRLRKISRARVASNGLARVGYGVGRQLASWALFRGIDARGVAYVSNGVGFIGACMNRLVVEYARVEASDPAN